jgi:multidrug efflux pump subunit AcrA (membrane-fusion protein)
MPESTRTTRRARHVRRVIVGGVAAVVVLAAGTTAWAKSGGSGGSYRTATVGRHSVQQVLTTTGTLSPLHSADVDFQVAGTVRRIVARQGETVRAGQRLATLDRASLTAARAAAKSTLQLAELQLATDSSGESTTTAATTTASAQTTAFVMVAAAPPSPRPTGSGNGPTSGGSLTATVTHDQAAVVTAQHTTDTDLAIATKALQAEKTACTADLSSGTCAADATALLADQTAVSADQKAVLGAETTLDTDVAKLLASAQQPTSSPSPRPSSSATPHGGTTGSPRSGGSTGSGGTRTVTAATLAADEASIDTDRAALATARANLAEATLTSPISGRVTAVTLHKGDVVSGSSSSTSPAFQIRAAGHDQVTLSLTAAQVRQVAIGMTATATPDGATTSLRGKVISIGAAASDSTYPVAIELDGSSSALVSGADAAVSVMVSQARQAITVPTSAVHRSGSQAYVELLNAGKEERRTVVIGTTGADLTAIVSGLTPGQQVVLADMDAAVPSSSSTLTTRGGRGGFGGAGSSTGGFSGPPGGGFGGGAGFAGGGLGGAAQ